MAIGAEMKASAGPPPAELVSRMHATQERLRTVGMIAIVLLIFRGHRHGKREIPPIGVRVDVPVAA